MEYPDDDFTAPQLFNRGSTESFTRVEGKFLLCLSSNKVFIVLSVKDLLLFGFRQIRFNFILSLTALSFSVYFKSGQALACLLLK